MYSRRSLRPRHEKVREREEDLRSVQQWKKEATTRRKSERELSLTYLWNRPNKLPTQPSTWAKRTLQRRLPSPTYTYEFLGGNSQVLIHHPYQPSISTQKQTSITTHTYVVVWVHIYSGMTNMLLVLLMSDPQHIHLISIDDFNCLKHRIIWEDFNLFVSFCEPNSCWSSGGQSVPGADRHVRVLQSASNAF